jgi:hypothetical protein
MKWTGTNRGRKVQG